MKGWGFHTHLPEHPWSTCPTFRRPCLVPGAGSVQGGMRSGSLEQLLVVQSSVFASEVPEHRGKGGGAAKGKVSLCFLDKFNACGSWDGDMHPWEVSITTAGINLPGTGWALGWLGCFTFPWHKMTTSDPTGILAMSPGLLPCPTHPWPQLAPLLLPWAAVLVT